MMSQEGFKLQIRRVDEDAYEIVIDGEDDTLGHLLSTYLELSEDVQLSYYTRPHPLEEKIIVYVRLKDKNADIKEIVKKVIKQILGDIDSMREEYLKALEEVGVNREDVLP